MEEVSDIMLNLHDDIVLIVQNSSLENKIDLRHSLYGNSQDDGVCNNEAITAISTGILVDCYASHY